MNFIPNGVKSGHVVVMKSKNKKVLISIIIPCYNSGKTIRKTVNSILNQTWANIELIVVNDGSNDLFTLTILKQLPNCKIINQENKGLPTARNIGFYHAKGEYIFFLDADDWIGKETLQELYTTLSSNNMASFSFPSMKLEGDRSNKISNDYNFFEQLFINKLPYSILISNSSFKKIGGYNESFRDGYEDWELNVRLGRNSVYGLKSPKAVLYYNVSNLGMLKSKSILLHGYIWKEIQKQNSESYRFIILIKNLIKWKKIKSSNNLILYIIYYLLWLITPIKFFNIIFNLLVKFKSGFLV